MYASAVGTTVLQLKEIPERPTSWERWLNLFGVADSLDEAAAKEAFRDFGEVVEVADRRVAPVFRSGEFAVRFASHAAAEKVLNAPPTSELWEGIDHLYTDMPYDKSGW
jgi:hypothetical protein